MALRLTTNLQPDFCYSERDVGKETLIILHFIQISMHHSKETLTAFESNRLARDSTF